MSKVNITAAIKAEAEKIGKKLGVSTLFVNTKGEFFTEENRALLSENHDKESIDKISISIADKKAPGKVETKPSAEFQQAEKKLASAKGALVKAEKALSGAKPEKKAAAQASFDAAKQAVLDAENELTQLQPGE